MTDLPDREVNLMVPASAAVHGPPSPDSPATWQHDVVRAARAQGLYITLPRLAIVDWIAHEPAPFTAEQVVRALEAQRGISSRPTVYRTLEWLRSTGWIGRVLNESEEHVYARRWPGHRHYAICTRCGRAQALEECHVDTFLAPLLAQIAFEPHGHLLEVHGLCRECRSQHADEG